MIEVASIRFNEKGKIYFFSPQGMEISTGDNVIVETAKGLEYGTCVYGNHNVADSMVVQPLRQVLRHATPADDERNAINKQRDIEAFAKCQEKIIEYDLPMKLVSAEQSFDGSEILFFFTSDGRIDFRALVRNLAATFKTRINMRQIGVRDEAKMLGGLGVCGKQFCCSQFLTDFHPVSIKMAKTQGLSLNPVKISGTCGRLMCCLKYEEVAYQDLVKRAPKVDSFVESPAGKGSVVGINLLRGTAKVRLEDGGDTTLKTFNFDELDVLGGKNRRLEYQTAKAEGKLEEAGFKPSVIRAPEPKLSDKTESTFGRPSSFRNLSSDSPAQTSDRGNDNRNRGNAARSERQHDGADQQAGQSKSSNRNRNRRRRSGGGANTNAAPQPAAKADTAPSPTEGGGGTRQPAPRPEPVKKSNPRRFRGGRNRNSGGGKEGGTPPQA